MRLNCSSRRFVIACFLTSKESDGSISIGWYLSKIALDLSAYSGGNIPFCNLVIKETVGFPCANALVNVLSKSATTWNLLSHHEMIFWSLVSKSCGLGIRILDIKTLWKINFLAISLAFRHLSYQRGVITFPW